MMTIPPESEKSSLSLANCRANSTMVKYWRFFGSMTFAVASRAESRGYRRRSRWKGAHPAFAGLPDRRDDRRVALRLAAFTACAKREP